jgi:hypothetical protein
MATLEHLRRTVGRKSGMDYSNAGVDRDLIDTWINEGVREVLLRSHCYTAASVLETTADEWQYDLSTNIMVIKLIYRSSEDSPMERVAPEEILDLRRATGTGSDATTLRWALEGANMLLLWPTPTSAYDINIVYVPKPAEMSANEHDPSSGTYGGVPVEYHKAIELWALSNASDHEHEGRTQSGSKYLVEFENYISRVVRPAVNRKGGLLSPARVGRRPRFASSNDAYPRF